jgi:two-component system, OmpR family, sensor histidine kinase VicK
VTLLKKNNQLNRLYLAFTIGFSVLTLAIVVLVLINYRRSRKNVRQLTLLNNQISEQKEQLEFNTSELRKINREKDRILHIVAHDLRNPIGGILGLSDIVLAEEVEVAQKNSWSMVKSTAQVSLKLINRLLELETDFSHENVGPKTNLEVIDVTQQVTALLQFKANQKKQKLELELQPGPLNILANREKIWRVLSNIIGNAIKFSPSDSSIHISVAAKNKNAVICITDSGIGIPESLRPFIFDMFTKAKRKGTEGEASFGLGLSISRQIVEDHHGRIWFESSEGNGATFFIELPLTA